MISLRAASGKLLTSLSSLRLEEPLGTSAESLSQGSIVAIVFLFVPFWPTVLGEAVVNYEHKWD